MSKRNETGCDGCPSRRRCADGGEPALDGPAGLRLVALAAAHFLAPLVAAIVAAALLEGSRWQAAAGGGAFVAVLVITAAVGALARRRAKR